MSAAGVFYAVAAFWAVRELLTRDRRRAATALVCAVLLVAGGGWAIRTIGVNHVLRTQAFVVHNDWAEIPLAMETRGTWPSEESTQRLVIALRDQALRMPVVNPWFVPRWADRVFEGDYF
jgi:glucose dehydrogenase